MGKPLLFLMLLAKGAGDTVEENSSVFSLIRICRQQGHVGNKILQFLTGDAS